VTTANEGHLTPFREFCRRNKFGPTTGYALIASGRLKTVKIGTRRYVSNDNEKEFFDLLEQEAAAQRAAA
jgi:hypothetical protein